MAELGADQAGLTGKQFLAPGTPYWQWFEDLMGGHRLFAPSRDSDGVRSLLEDRRPSCDAELCPRRLRFGTSGMSSTRARPRHVYVLARADESTYKPNKPMGDHPMIWTNETYRRALYIGIGHDPTICTDPQFRHLDARRHSVGSLARKNRDVAVFSGVGRARFHIA